VRELEADDWKVLVARLEEKAFAASKALEIQTLELRRRLDELNGEAGRLKSMQAHYVSRETYESKHEDLVRRINMMESFKANMEGRMWIGGAVILILAAVIAVIIPLVMKA
jgi:hypothetical protein